ncbi:MAG: M56 family metallopeptidase [Bacteroidota bacterium]
MPAAFLENGYFFQSLGWAIANSFWQAGLLWLLYKIITGLNIKASSIFKHNLGLLLLFTSTIWFIYTTVQTYYSPKVLGAFLFTTNENISDKIKTTLPYFAIIYFFFLLLYGFRFVQNFITTVKLKTTDLIKPGIDIRFFVKQTSLHLGIKKKIKVWISENIHVPSVIGFFKPVILLPAAAIANLSTQQLEAILLHELAHIKRHDFFLNLLQTIAKLILFFNPFAALLNRYIDTERENCCDDWVLNYKYDKENYATALLQIEMQRQQKMTFVLAATNGKKQLLGRIKRLFTIQPNTILTRIQKIQIASLALVLGFAIAFAVPLKTNEKTVLSTVSLVNVQKADLSPITLTQEKEKAITVSAKSKKKIFNKKNDAPAVTSDINKSEPYSIAVINEELLNDQKEKDFEITAVSNPDQVDNPKFLIKIEEEKSGVENNSVYYFQLSQDSGKAAMKPLIFLNKPAKNKSETKKLPDTSNMPGKKITS